MLCAKQSTCGCRNVSRQVSDEAINMQQQQQQPLNHPLKSRYVRVLISCAASSRPAMLETAQHSTRLATLSPAPAMSAATLILCAALSCHTHIVVWSASSTPAGCIHRTGHVYASTIRHSKSTHAPLTSQRTLSPVAAIYMLSARHCRLSLLSLYTSYSRYPWPHHPR